MGKPSVSKRKAISKKTRFEIFKRDGFVCQYCGNTPPTVVLQVDHIHPVAEGGDNSMDNLITCCAGCNIGKGARLISSAPQSLKDKAENIKEAEEQLMGFYKIMNAKRERIDREAWQIVDYLKIQNNDGSVDTPNFTSIKRFLEKISFYAVAEAAEIAWGAKPYSANARFRYFCGVCWNKIKAASNEQ